jgi:23S rRNA (guanosine2251-2'-O)-methyltransferase
MLVYGKNVAIEALKKKEIIKKAYLSNEFSDDNIKKELINSNIEIIYEKKEKIDNLVKTYSQGIVLDIKNINYKYFEDLKEDDNADFVVILDHIEDPQNFGAIIRTCDCAGVDYIIKPNKRCALVTASVVKASAGSALSTKIVEVANLCNTIRELKKKGYWIVGTDSNGVDYTKVNYSSKVAIVIGSEGKGLTKIVRDNCDFIASIPIKGSVNSLNASVACGIVLYEVVKKR